MNKEAFYKAMVKRFGCIPALTNYSSSAKYDIPLDEALDLVPDDDDELRARLAQGGNYAGWIEGYKKGFIDGVQALNLRLKEKMDELVVQLIGEFMED